MFIEISNRSVVRHHIPRQGIHEFYVPINIDRTNGVSEFWLFFSKGKKSTLIDYLIGKLLWDELSKLEAEILLLLPESTKFPFYNILKSIKVRGKKLTRERYNIAAPKLGQSTFTRQQYLSLSGQSIFLLLRIKRTYPKTAKYSGYVKGYRDHGTLRLDKVEIYPDPERYSINVEEILDLLLTVEEFPQGYILPEDGPISPKQELT